MKKKFILILIPLAVIFLVIQVSIITKPYRQIPKPSDAIIVLGCRLWGDQPSPMLIYRLDEALKLYNEGYASKIIVSGSQGEDEWITEAAAMKTYLEGKGVDPEGIIEEDQSFSTFENLYYSKKIMEDQNLKNAIIVTNAFHIQRSLMIANRLDMDVSSSPAKSYPNPLLILRCYVREVFAYVKDFFVSF